VTGRCYASAHRGLSSEVTENTVAGFQAAAQAGFRAVELDCRVTRDGEVVVLHDASPARTTVEGSARVADMRYDELRGYRTPHGPVPRLDDLFGALASWPGAWNLEVKATKATEPMLHLVEHHGLTGRVLVSAFDPKPLEVARDLMPEVPRAYITSGDVSDEEVRMAKDLGCRWFNAHHESLGQRAVKDLHAAGFLVGAWTVNSPTAAVALANRGVACVITDRRDVLAALGDVTPFV
jgi:glycerophosphoryl diester phosphodiesterase